MTDEGAAKRVDVGVLGKAGAGVKAAKRVDGGVLGKAGTGGKAARRSSGGILTKAGAGGKAVRRSSGGNLYGGRSRNRVGGMNQVRFVYTRSVAAEIAEVIVGAREWWDGVARNG